MAGFPDGDTRRAGLSIQPELFAGLSLGSLRSLKKEWP